MRIALSAASLASSLSDDLLAKATVEVIQHLRNKVMKSEMIRTNIQMIGALRLVLPSVLFPLIYCIEQHQFEEELWLFR